MQSCTFAVINGGGKRLQEQVTETHSEPLRSFLKGVAGQKYLCMEEGTYSEWLFELLSPLVTELVVIQPEKRDGAKNDSFDAWDLAEKLRTGQIQRSIYKPMGRFSGLRSAVRAYDVIQRDMVRCKNRLKALYRSRGLWGMGDAIYREGKREEWLIKLPNEHYRNLATLLSGELDGLVKMFAEAEAWLLKEAKRPTVKRIETAPGIGSIRASQIVATVVTPHRFRTNRQFWSYCGLAIVTRSSSDWVKNRSGKWIRQNVDHTRGLNRNRQPMLKSVFKGAAMTVTTSMPEHPLCKHYQRLLDDGTKPNLARLTIARRIASAVLAIWKNQEDYDVAKQEPR